jgi:hypothetical protein
MRPWSIRPRMPGMKFSTTDFDIGKLHLDWPHLDDVLKSVPENEVWLSLYLILGTSVGQSGPSFYVFFNIIPCTIHTKICSHISFISRIYMVHSYASSSLWMRSRSRENILLAVELLLLVFGISLRLEEVSQVMTKFLPIAELTYLILCSFLLAAHVPFLSCYISHADLSHFCFFVESPDFVQ